MRARGAATSLCGRRYHDTEETPCNLCLLAVRAAMIRRERRGVDPCVPCAELEQEAAEALRNAVISAVVSPTEVTP